MYYHFLVLLLPWIISCFKLDIPLHHNKDSHLFSLTACVSSVSFLCKEYCISFKDRDIVIFDNVHKQNGENKVFHQLLTPFQINNEYSFYQTSVYIDGYDIQNIIIKLYHNKYTMRHGNFGLNWNNNDNGSNNNFTSLIEKLFEFSKSKKVFYIDINNNNPKLIIGDYPSKYNDIKYYKYCKIKQHNNKKAIGYYCDLDSVYVNNKHILIEKEIQFSIEHTFIYVQRDTMEMIVNEMFGNDNITSKDNALSKCEIVRGSNNNQIFIRCDKDVDITKLNNNIHMKYITFIFGKYSLRIMNSDLFITYYDYIYYGIVFDNERSQNELIFGYPLFKNYYIIFDYDNQIIIFIHK
jgi:hypothetical protein